MIAMLRRTLASTRKPQNAAQISSPRPIASASAKQLRAGEVLSLIPGRLSFAMHSSTEMTKRKIEQEPNNFYFSSDCQDLYEPFCADFGPVNLLVVHNFCGFMREYWNHPMLQSRELIYYTVGCSLCTWIRQFRIRCF
jgi:hypothetical protein